MFTVDEIRDALPTQFKKSINQQLVDNINQTLSDPEEFERYRDNLIGYTHVLQQGKFKIQNYLDAVRYVSFKLMGLTNTDAYSRTFPDKIKRFKAKQLADKDIASYITAYNKSKLVSLIMEQSLIPTYVLNQDIYQEAINVQATLMRTAKSEKVRSDAANSLLTHLKQPETQKLQLDIGLSNTEKTIDSLRSATAELVAQQKALIQSGAMDAQQMAHQKLIVDAEYEEVPNAQK